MFTLCCSLLLLAPADAPEKDPVPAAKKELFAAEDWYKKQEGKEQDFIGVLKYTPRAKGVIGFGRFNPYRLELAKENAVREVYIGGKEEILKEYHGKRVKITGKPVDMEVEGRNHKEIWPARVELLPDAPKKADPKESPARPAPDGFFNFAPVPKEGESKSPTIIARSPIRMGVKGGEATQLVIRSAEELAKAMGIPEADKAMSQAAQQLKVKEIDFKQQMIVVVSAGSKPTGGYSVEVTGLEVKEKELVVKWKLNSPGPNSIVTQAFTHPAQTILVDRFEGKVTFDPVAPKGNPIPKRGIDGLKKQ